MPLTDRPKNSLTAGMVVCFALAGWHFAGNPASEASVAESTSSVTAVTSELGAADASGPATTSIEEIRLGQRVVGKTAEQQKGTQLILSCRQGKDPQNKSRPFTIPSIRIGRKHSDATGREF